MTKELVKQETFSSRFVKMVQREFEGTVGMVKLSEFQKTLAQHLYIKVDTQLKDLEAKRMQTNKKIDHYVWENVNLEKLAIDAVHRVNLGLDALIPNHIHPIPYFNKKKQKYDLDLRVGYVGKHYYRTELAVEKPVDIIYELVFSNDEFVVSKKGINQNKDAYEFKITKPFDRGDVIGGFGYIIYTDPTKNKLVLLPESEFIKSKNAAMTKDFWNNHGNKMRLKTLVHRTTELLTIDPKKVNESFAIVEAEDNNPPANDVQAEIAQDANTKVIDITPEKPKPVEKPPEDLPLTESEKQDIIADEIKDSEKEKEGPPF